MSSSGGKAFVLSWVCCTTYLIASTSYRSTVYILDHEDVLLTDFLMAISCLVTICFAFIGHIFIKTEVIHWACVLFVCIPICFIIPAISGYGLYQLGHAKRFDEPMITTKVVEHWRTYHKVHPVLEAVQRDQKCCGLEAPSDYREFIYNRGLSPLCEDEEFDVPLSCCNLAYLYFHCALENRDSFCISSHDLLQEAIIFDDEAMNEQLSQAPTARDKAKLKCDNARKFNATVQSEGTWNNTIWTKGCMPLIVDNAQDMRDAHYFFFFVIIILCIAMMFSFLTYWREIVQIRRSMLEHQPK